MAIKTINLTKKFGDFVAVDSVSFEVKDGEIYGFLGANGAGKTTTIRMLCGILQPTSGDAYVNDISITEEPEKVKKIIGYMSQKFSLYTNLTVEENMRFYAGVYNLKKQTTEINMKEIIEELMLKDYLNTIVKDLPSGIKQRVSLSCAIIHTPKVLFLDEPTAGVDPFLRQIFWKIIKNLLKKNITVFVTTHYMDEVEYCDKVALMNNGKIVKEGSVEFLKKETLREKVFEIQTQDVILAYKSVIGLKENIGEISLHGSNLHIIPYKENSLDFVLDILKKKNIRFEMPQQVMPNMEDVFIRVVKG